ncbi:MAG: M20/M25/M40 family metallo-hydrolase, partial [Vicinamibacterales bacterium]
MTQPTRQFERVRAVANDLLDDVVDRAISICEIPSPTGSEVERGRLVAALLADLGYQPDTDHVGNVYARRGNRGGNVVMLAAHLD